MKKIAIILAITAFFLLGGNAKAQDAQFAYATYFICTPDGESRADEIINSSYKPHYDAAVEHGDIVSWSWLQHYAGGEWRRVLVVISNNVESMLDASGALGEIISERTPEAGRAFSAICSAHVDYVWQTMNVGSGTASEERGDAGFTVYMQCDMNREKEADKLMRETIGPVFDKHTREGELTSWGWLRQYMGGKYRRILTMGSTDHKTLMLAREAIHADFEDRKVSRAVEEMNEICHTHQDYMWDVLIQEP